MIAMNIRSLFFSLVISVLPVASVQACFVHQSQSILLENAPKKLNGASFMGKVKITRVNHTSEKTMVRAIVHESTTHPHFVGREMMLFYSPIFNLCGSPFIPIDVGSEGFSIGRALNLGSDILYVKPYKIYESFVPYQVITDNGTVDIEEFY